MFVHKATTLLKPNSQGTPKGEVCEVVNPTFHKIAAAVAE